MDALYLSNSVMLSFVLVVHVLQVEALPWICPQKRSSREDPLLMDLMIPGLAYVVTFSRLRTRLLYLGFCRLSEDWAMWQLKTPLRWTWARTHGRRMSCGKSECFRATGVLGLGLKKSWTPRCRIASRLSCLDIAYQVDTEIRIAHKLGNKLGTSAMSFLNLNPNFVECGNYVELAMQTFINVPLICLSFPKGQVERGTWFSASKSQSHRQNSDARSPSFLFRFKSCFKGGFLALRLFLARSEGLLLGEGRVPNMC